MSKEFSSESKIDDSAITMDSSNEYLDSLIDREAVDVEKLYEENRLCREVSQGETPC
jgi:hypothetical protein